MLNELVIPTETVTTSVGPITVRGISFVDLHAMIQRGHGEAVSSLISGNLDFTQLVIVGSAAIGDLIALAADRPNDGALFARLPIGDQTRLAVAIYRLTNGEIDLGNVVRRLVEAIPTWAAAIRTKTAVSPRG